MKSRIADDVSLLLARARDTGDLGRNHLFASYHPYLMLLARSQVGRRLQAKLDPADLVQETFLEAHKQFSLFRGTTEAELTSWLRRILAGQIALTLRHYLGTKARDVKLEQELLVQLDHSSQLLNINLADPGSTPSQQVARREQAVLLAEKLEALTPEYREVILLRNIEGLGFGDVGERMGRSENSTQKLYVRALAALQKAMGAT